LFQTEHNKIAFCIFSPFGPGGNLLSEMKMVKLKGNFHGFDEGINTSFFEAYEREIIKSHIQSSSECENNF